VSRFASPWPVILFVLIATLIAVYAMVGYRNLRGLGDDTVRITESHNLVHDIDGALAATALAETATRGYIATGDTSYLAPFEAAAKQAQEHLVKLQDLSQANNLQHWRAGRFRQLVTDKNGVMREVIRVRREKGLDAALASLQQSRGPGLVDEIQQVAGEMRSTALQLLEYRTAMMRATFRALLRAGAIMAAVAVVLLTASYVLFWRAYAGQTHLARALATRKEELEAAVRSRTVELRALADELEKRVEERTLELSRANGDLRLENAERRRVEAALIEADRRKDEFLAMLGHELRNPLTPIRCALDVLQAPRIGAEDQEKATSILQRQVHQLVRIVDDLMDVSRITLGKIKLELDTVPVAEVVEGAVEAARPQLEERGHQIRIAIPERALRVRGDSARLGQVLQNLLTNAAKYTDPGGRIDVSVSGRNGDVQISVRDNGLGIAPEQLVRIFEPYTQVDQTRDHADGGIGMGLTVVRRLVEMHGGSVSVTSEGRGRGSEFTIRLPALAPEPDPQLSASPGPSA